MKIVLTLVLILAGSALKAETAEAEKERVCSDRQNAALPVCLGLPDASEPITNFAPVVSPIGGLAAALGAVLGAGGASPSTSSTSTSGTK